MHMQPFTQHKAIVSSAHTVSSLPPCMWTRRQIHCGHPSSVSWGVFFQVHSARRPRWGCGWWVGVRKEGWENAPITFGTPETLGAPLWSSLCPDNKGLCSFAYCTGCRTCAHQVTLCGWPSDETCTQEDVQLWPLNLLSGAGGQGKDLEKSLVRRWLLNHSECEERGWVEQGPRNDM